MAGTHIITNHVKEWGKFQLHRCGDARSAVVLIKQAAENDSKDCEGWFRDHGGREVWISNTYEELRASITTQDVIIDLEMNEEFQHYSVKVNMDMKNKQRKHPENA